MTDCLLNWVDAQKKEIYPKGWQKKERPLWSKRNHKKETHSTTDNVSSYDVENPNSTDKERDLLLVRKPRSASRKIERMPQGNKRNRWTAIHWSTHQGEQNEAEYVAIV